MKDSDKRPTSEFTKAVAAELKSIANEDPRATQNAISEKWGYRQSQVSDALNGKIAIDTDLLDSIAGLKNMTGLDILREVSARMIRASVVPTPETPKPRSERSFRERLEDRQRRQGAGETTEIAAQDQEQGE